MRILKRLLTFVIISWGLLALIVRAATPLLADYRDALASQLSESLGVSVEIGGLRARWYGLRPLVELNDIRIGQPDDELNIARATFDIDLSGVVGGDLLDALRVTVDGLQLTLIRDLGGQLHLEGLNNISASRRQSGRLRLPARLRLLNTRLVWIDRRSAYPPLNFDKVAVLLTRRGDSLQLRAHVDTVAGSADVAADINGYLGRTDWSGQSQLTLWGLDVTRLFAPHLPQQYGLRSLKLDLNSSTRWQNALPVSSYGDFRISDLHMVPTAPESKPLKLAAVSAGFSVQRDEQVLRLGLKDLRLDLGKRQWPAGDVALALENSTDGGHKFQLHADYLRLDDLVKLIEVRPPFDWLQEPLSKLRPSGEIRDLKLIAERHGEALKWRGEAMLDDVTSLRWGKIPGITRLSGHLLGNSDHVSVQLDSKNSELDLVPLFRWPLALNRLQGRVDLEQFPDGWRLSSRELTADTPHISTRTRLLLVQQNDAAPFLDLQTDFHDGDALFANRFYPTAIMGKGLVHWLDRSIISGKVVSGTALVHGPLDEFAFEKTRSGRFEVSFDAEDMLLDYRNGWPRLEDLSAHVQFHGNQLNITAHDGRVYDSRLGETRAHIDSLNPISSLKISSALKGPLRDPLRALGEPALRDRFGRFAAALRAQGDSLLKMDFEIPLNSSGEYQLDGRLMLAGAKLTLPDWDFTMRDIKGQLGFTLDGLSARNIAANALGAPVSVDILPLAGGATRVRAKARLGVPALRKQLPQLPLQMAKGRADFEVAIEVPGRGAKAGNTTTLAVDSTLQGIGVALPEPFGKIASERRNLRVRVPLGSGGASGSLNYGDLVSARFSTDGTRTDVTLGGSQATLSQARGIRIEGQLETLDIAAWQEAISALPDSSDAIALPMEVELNIDTLALQQTAIKNLDLQVSHQPGAWRGTLQAARLAGRFEVPDKLPAQPIRLDLDHLQIDLPLDTSQQAVAPPPAPDKGPDPADLPGMVLNIEKLQVNDARLGRVELVAERVPHGLKLTRATLTGGPVDLTGGGHWLRLNGVSNSRLSSQISTEDVGQLLGQLGYSEQMQEAGGHFELGLRWPGHPGQLHRETMQGSLQLDIGAGRLVEVDPGVTRIVGLLNLSALTRRLRLDFSDLFKKGYSFDSIRGRFRFADGLARTDDLELVGPSGRIELTGTADLTRRTLNQKVKVTPKLDATLPIAGALAGGPVAGVAVLVAQAVMKKQVDQINRFEYSISGPWNDPDIEQLDSGGTLSKILQPFTGGTHKADKDSQVLPTQTSDQRTAADTEEAASPVQPALPEPAGQEPTTADEGHTEATEMPEEKPGPLRRLFNLFKNGDSHGLDLPGTD